VKLQISIDNKLYEVEVEVPEETGPRYTNGYVPPYAPTSRVTIPTIPPVPTAPTAGGAPSNGGGSGNVCKSPMAGVVVKINAQLGQQIQENDLLMVLEAMKMETNITAPVSGKIKAINVNPGDPVTVDQVVVEFD
jgi:methylmalonyl-CoA carboxyltransferase small subunit